MCINLIQFSYRLAGYIYSLDGYISYIPILHGYNSACSYSYGHLLVITGYKWDYTIYKWGYKYL
jgi:hypothetical protein